MDRRFVTNVRQYAALTQRMRVSYSDPVNTVYNQAVKRIEAGDLPPDQKQAEIEQLRGMIEREYAPVDRDFHWNDQPTEPPADQPQEGG